MATFELVILLIGAVLISAVLEMIIPRVSLPLVQIGLGVVIGLLATSPIKIDFNPEFFLFLFIAPLLFRDAKESDKLGLLRNRQAILSLAVGLVIAIMLSVGFTLHFFAPSIPLAAAFALGAALGPTDAVAVASLSSTAEPNRKENALLSGEALINDASGVVAFQFAVSAAVTGTFAIFDASISFVISFFGGIFLGAFLGWLAFIISERLTRMGLDSTTFHVMFDVTLPFLVYLVAEMIHVSGILAVVAAGIFVSARKSRTISPRASQLSIVSTSVWNVLTFALNGIVFTILGIELPQAMRTTWSDVGLSNTSLILYVVLITAILVITRFIWVLGLEFFGKDRQTKKRRGWYPGIVRSALVTTIGGPKGAVTLSVVLATPYVIANGSPFPHRDLLIFLASGTILLTLLLANFLLPVLAPKNVEKEEDNEEVIIQREIEIFRRIIERLTAARTKDTAWETNMVIGSYNERISHAQVRWNLDTVPESDLRHDVLDHEIEYIELLIEEGRADEKDGYICMRRLERIRSQITSKHLPFDLYDIIRRFPFNLRSLVQIIDKPGYLTMNSGVRELRIKALKEGAKYLRFLLKSNDDRYPADVISRVLISQEAGIRNMEMSRPSVTQYAHAAEKTDAVMRQAYRFELEEIQKALEEKRISKATAKKMRDNVYLMMVDLELFESE